ncbi:ankyrin repeat domain-containing protein [bacterium]|nr:ankyrin repeat domain-containing protein [bacterium]
MLSRLLLVLALGSLGYADPIHTFVMKSQRESILAELGRGVSIDLKDHNGETPLHWAVRHDRPDMVLFLLGRGADPDLPDPYGHAPLYHAQRVELAGPLLERGANPSRLDQSHSTPLHQVCLYNKPEVVALMLKRGALVNQASSYGTTPLLAACHFGSAHVIDMLLLHGARLDVTDKEGLNPLQTAARAGSRQAVERLVRAGADPSDPKAFALAVRSNGQDLVDYLGGLVTPTPEALLSAISWGRLPLFQALLARGGKLEPALVRGAAQHGQVEILTWLLDQGQSVESPDEQKQTALMLAAGAHHPQVIQLLLARGANLQGQDARGLRAADYGLAAIHRQRQYIEKKSRSRAAFTDRLQAEAELAAMEKTLQSVFQVTP